MIFFVCQLLLELDSKLSPEPDSEPLPEPDSEPHSQNRLCEAFLLLMYGISPYGFIKRILCKQACSASVYKSAWLRISAFNDYLIISLV